MPYDANTKGQAAVIEIEPVPRNDLEGKEQPPFASGEAVDRGIQDQKRQDHGTGDREGPTPPSGPDQSTSMCRIHI